jgi:hypothetical protein
VYSPVSLSLASVFTCVTIIGESENSFSSPEKFTKILKEQNKALCENVGSALGIKLCGQNYILLDNTKYKKEICIQSFYFI